MQLMGSKVPLAGTQDENPEYFKYNQIYHLFRVPFRLERFLFCNMLFQVQALLYTLIVLPFRFALTLIGLAIKPWNVLKLSGRR